MVMRLLVLLCFFLLATSALAAPRPYLQRPTLSFANLPPLTDPHALNPKVRYIGGYELTAHGTDQVTGLSDLQLFPDGAGVKVEAISDEGVAVTFNMQPDEKGGLKDSEVEIDRLRDQNGDIYDNKDFNDAEDIAYDPVRLTRYVSFERFRRIMSYDSPQIWQGKGQVIDFAGLPEFPTNEGMEGLTYINDKSGAFLLVGVEAGGFWRCGLSDHACGEVAAPEPPGFLYKMTSLAVLDYSSPAHDHDILALYRYFLPFDGLRSVLSLLHYDNKRLVKVNDLARIDVPLPRDNYEGVAALKTPTGYRLYLVCDGLNETAKPKILLFDWTQ